MKSKIRIFDYLSPIDYLQDIYQEKLEFNKRYSIRAWSKDLGLTEATTLSQILKGKRQIPSYYVQKLGSSLSFTKLEKSYLMCIVEISNSKDDNITEVWIKRAQDIFSKANFQMQLVEKNEFKLFETTVPMLLLELINLKGFCLDPEWIQDKLCFRLDKDIIEKSYSELTKRGYIYLQKDGSYAKRNKFLSSEHDVPSNWVKRFHQNSLKRASAALVEQDLDEREFGAYILPIELSKLPEIKEKFRAFSQKILAKYDTPDNRADAIYQFNVNLFAQAKN